MWIPKSIQVFEERVAAPELLPDDPLQVALDALQVFDGQVEERVLAEESLVALDVDELDLLPVAELLGEAVDEAHGLEGLRRLAFRWGHLRARSGSGASTAGALWCSISASYRLQGNPVMERRCSM